MAFFNTIPFKRCTKWLLSILAALSAVTAVLVLTLPYSLPAILKTQEIHLQLEQPRWHRNGFGAKRIHIKYQQHRIDLSQPRLQWSWHPLRLESLSADTLDGLAGNLPDSSESSPGTTSAAAYFKYLPRHLDIAEANVEIAGLGLISGQLELDLGAERNPLQPQQLHASLKLYAADKPWLPGLPQTLLPGNLALDIQSEPGSPGFYRLNLLSQDASDIRLDGLLSFSVEQQWQVTLQQVQLSISLPSLDFLGMHTDAAELQLTNAQLSATEGKPVRIELHAPLLARLNGFKHPQLHAQDWQLSGELNGNLDELQGEFNLHGNHGLDAQISAHWHEQQLNASLQLEPVPLTGNNPLKKIFVGWPAELQMHKGRFDGRLAINYQQQQLSGELLSRFGNTSATFGGHHLQGLELVLNADWLLEHDANFSHRHTRLDNTGFSFALANYRFADTFLEQLAGGFTLHGTIDAQQLDLQLTQPASLTSQTNSFFPGWSSQKFSASLEQMRLSGPLSPQQLTLDGTLKAELNRLASTTLQPQNWHMHARISGPPDNLSSHASLTSQHGLKIDSHAQGNLLHLKSHGQIRQIDFSQHNPLAKSLRHWPQLLDLEKGTLDANLSIEYHQNRPLALDLEAKAKALNGIYNRSQLTDANLSLNSRLRNNQLNTRLTQLDIREINPGVPLSNIKISGARYLTDIRQPEQGALEWQEISARLLGGELHSTQHHVHLDRDNPVKIELQGLQLQEAMRVYPMDGLTGTGTLDGSIPMRVSLQGINVDKGRLHTRPPGGKLQFQSDDLARMAKTNPAIQLLNQAMSDFNYHLLDSELDFDQSGKLNLNIRLHGSNPEIENGRPIHLNLNLEENLYALLTSIQLNNHVSETIIERIRQHLQRDNH